MSYPFKICDPVHGFIRFGVLEQKLIDSIPFQRLRYIHQMGTAYLVYPGATHTRFEHSLGVMELAGRIYATLIGPHNQVVSLDKTAEELTYWLLILRLAALCHDLGHLPFSHTAEKSLLPNGGHEQMTLALIRSPELQPIWRMAGPQAEDDIVKLAVAPADFELTPWEKVLSQVITEDNFGADRIDYLIRDGHYTGVGYGHFDYHQLIDSLRILANGSTLTLGVTASGIQSVESLWIARYMMYARVYHHPKVRVYSNHMRNFMAKHYHNLLHTDVADYVQHTDYTLLTALSMAAQRCDYDALCLLKQEKAFYEVSFPHFSDKMLSDLEKVFGDDIFIDHFPTKPSERLFPVYSEEDGMSTSMLSSPFLRDIPAGSKPLCVYAHPLKHNEIKEWLMSQLQKGL